MHYHLSKVRKYIILDIFSIGPYHRGRRHLRYDEFVKWHFFGSFLLSHHLDLHDLVHVMTDIVTDARRCYSYDVTLPTLDFLEFEISLKQ